MVTITRDTLDYTASEFFRDVLRNNLTDPTTVPRDASKWIYKGEPEGAFNTDDLPRVVIDTDTQTKKNLTMSRTKFHPNEYSLEVVVFADNLGDRDTVSGEIVKYLSTKTSEDSDGDSIEGQRFTFDGATSTTEPSWVGQHPKPVRIKRITARYKYHGE